MRRVWLAAVLSVAGCDGNQTKNGWYELDLAPARLWSGPTPPGSKFLIGTRVCPQVLSFRDGDTRVVSGWNEELYAACFELTAEGPARSEDGCFVLDAPGEVTLSATSVASCYLTDHVNLPPPDTYPMLAVAPDGVAPRIEWTFDEQGLYYLQNPDGSALPREELIPPPAATIQVAANQRWYFQIVYEDAAGDYVAYDREALQIDWEPNAPVGFDDGLLSTTLSEGQTVTIHVSLPNVPRTAAGSFVGTSIDRARSLKIVRGYAGDNGFFAARALVLDESGAPIVGSPVQWTVIEGPLVLSNDFEVADYVVGVDGCLPRPARDERRMARIRAELGDLSDEVEVWWLARGDEDPPADTDSFEPDERCPESASTGLDDRGCSCSTDRDSGPASLWLLVLFALGTRRRAHK